MGLAFKQIKTYAKLSVMVLIAEALLLVIVKNRNHKVDVWLFHSFPETNVLWVMLVSGASAVVIIWILGRVRRVLRDLREVRRARALEAKMDEQRRLAEELDKRESRIDEKIQRSINQPGDAPDER